MSAYSGRQGKGAARRRRERKRVEAQERDARTPVERTAKYRREHAKGAA